MPDHRADSAIAALTETLTRPRFHTHCGETHVSGPCADGIMRPPPAPYSPPVVERMNHLNLMVQAHQAAQGTPEADGDFTVAWEPSGWWISIVCPGHYAFEQDDRPDLLALLDEAVTYYGGTVPLWHDSGCQEHHPMGAAS